MQPILDQFLQFVQQGIAAIFKFVSLIWTWSIEQILRLGQSPWEHWPLWKQILLIVMVVMVAMFLFFAARQLWYSGVRVLGAFASFVAALIYTLSEVHDDAYYAGLAKQMANCPSIDRVYIKDMSGVLTPERARTLVPALLAALKGKPLELHSHTTIGLSPRTYVLVPDLGIEVVQTACGPLSNGSSLPEQPELDAYDQELMTAVVQKAEQAGKEVKPLIIPTNNPLHAALKTAQDLQVQEVIMGASNKWTADEQLEQIAFFWISLHHGQTAPLTVRILSRDRDMYLDLAGGNRIPKVSERARTVAAASSTRRPMSQTPTPSFCPTTAQGS